MPPRFLRLSISLPDLVSVEESKLFFKMAGIAFFRADVRFIRVQISSDN